MNLVKWLGCREAGVATIYKLLEAVAEGRWRRITGAYLACW
jgi:hypothetical protein